MWKNYRLLEFSSEYYSRTCGGGGGLGIFGKWLHSGRTTSGVQGQYHSNRNSSIKYSYSIHCIRHLHITYFVFEFGKNSGRSHIISRSNRKRNIVYLTQWPELKCTFTTKPMKNRNEGCSRVKLTVASPLPRHKQCVYCLGLVRRTSRLDNYSLGNNGALRHLHSVKMGQFHALVLQSKLRYIRNDWKIQIQMNGKLSKHKKHIQLSNMVKARVKIR